MKESGNRSRSVPPPVLHRPTSQEKDGRNSPAFPSNDYLSERAGGSMEDQQTFPSSFEEILEALHTQLHVEQVVALTQSYALRGLGGIGKTQIALEYAYRHALEYSAIFWIEAETIEHVMSSLLRIADLLQLPERQETDQQRIVAAVQRWLSSHSRWLLTWDNVEDLAMLDRFLPSARSGTILLTT